MGYILQKAHQCNVYGTSKESLVLALAVLIEASHVCDHGDGASFILHAFCSVKPNGNI